MTGVTAFSVQYQDARALPPAWLPGWLENDRLPDRVNLQIVTEHGAWPALVIALRAAPASDPGQSGFVIGGSAS